MCTVPIVAFVVLFVYVATLPTDGLVKRMVLVHSVRLILDAVLLRLLTQQIP